MTRALGCAVGLLACLVVPGPAAGQDLIVEHGGRRVVVTDAALRTLPEHTVRARIHESDPIEFAGVALGDILRHTGYSIDTLRGSKLADYLLVEAADGYRAVFSLAELSPALGGCGALLVYSADGARLGASDGPLRLVVPYETRPSRWVRQVVRLRILTAPAP